MNITLLDGHIGNRLFGNLISLFKRNKVVFFHEKKYQNNKCLALFLC